MRRTRFSVAEVATAVVLIVAIALMLFVSHLTSQTLDASRRWDSALEQIAVDVSQSHVWLEESLSGDGSVDVPAQVFNKLAEAEALTAALLHGGPSDSGDTEPIHGADLRQSIRVLQEHLGALVAGANARVSSPLDQTPGSRPDQSFDTLFRLSLRDIDSASAIFRTQDRADRRSLDRLNLVILGLLVILFGALVLIVRRHVHTLRRLGRTHHAILDSAAEGIYGVDREGRIVFVNHAVERITGWRPGDLIGTMVDHELHRPPSDAAAHAPFGSPVLATLADGEPRTVTGEIAWRRDGTSFSIDYTVAPILDPAESAAATVVFTDVTERLAAEEQLRFLANHDPLTGLWNRRRFEEELEKRGDTTQRPGDEAALLLIDIDHFKYVNDSHGHRVGDVLIRDIAMKLQQRCRRNGDVVARLGGDELALLLSRADRAGAEQFASEVLAEIRGHAGETDGRVVRVTASIGIALLDGSPWTVDDAMTAADRGALRSQRCRAKPLRGAHPGR